MIVSHLLILILNNSITFLAKNFIFYQNILIFIKIKIKIKIKIYSFNNIEYKFFYI